MPWCDDCSRFYNPNTLPPDGVCPGCGRPLVRPARLKRLQEGRGSGADAEAARAQAPGGTEPATGEDEHTPVPWHFWVLVVALAIYLGWRLIQLVQWLLR